LITHKYKSFDHVEPALNGGMQAEEYVKGVVVL